jgi:hypothetical protein
LYTEVLIGGFKWSWKSIQGHAAININGTVYSRDGISLATMLSQDYMAIEQLSRDTVGLVLDLTAEQELMLQSHLEQAIKDNTEYSLRNNNCSDTVSDALESIGMTVRGPWQNSWPMAPADLYLNLLKTKKVTNIKHYPRLEE